MQTDVKPTDILKHEHRIIEKALATLQGMIAALEQEKTLEAADAEGVLDFLKVFADQCHHGKEEDILFPALVERGVPMEGGPIGVMLSEHETGRALVRQLRETIEQLKQGEPESKQRFIQLATQLVQHYQQHIWKEDNVLFRMADEVLSEEAATKMVQQFEEVETKLGLGTHEEFERKAEQLAAKWSN